MKVKQLISQLKKLPPSAIVFKQDHDHDEPNTNGEVEFARLTEKADLIEDMHRYGRISEGDQVLLEEKPKFWVTLS